MIHYYQLKAIHYSCSLCTSLLSPFCSRTHPAFSRHVPLGSSGLWQVLRLSCSQWLWQSSGELVRWVLEYASVGSVWCFSRGYTGDAGPGKGDHGGDMLPHWSWPSFIPSTGPTAAGVDLDHQPRGSRPRFSKAPPSSPFESQSLTTAHPCGSQALSSCWQSVSMGHVGFFCMGGLPPAVS